MWTQRKSVRALIVGIFLGAYAIAAYNALYVWAVLNWIFGMQMCDSSCPEDHSTSIVTALLVAMFALCAVLGAVWISRGRWSPDED